MEAFKDFLSNYYYIFLILAFIFLLVIIVHYINKLKYNKSLKKVEKLETIKLDQNINL